MFDGPAWGPEKILDGLNAPQREAVAHHGAPLLVMAGAGSGKTRVLTRRIAYQLATGAASPSQILAITFTNKAAAEMKERVEALVGPAAQAMLVSTFHSACVRILRQQYRAAGLKSSFSIYDQNDSKALIASICKDMNIDVKHVAPKAIAARISDLKNELIGPEAFASKPQIEPIWEAVGKVYPIYTQRLKEANACDFDDLIMRTVDVLRSHPDVAEYYHRRFRHILIDEYQDTNHAQYIMVKLLAGDGSDGIEPAQLTVVGDSDQSIYAFRGATIRNIEEFEKDFPGARTVILDQNYRSTQNILSAANALIDRNPNRKPKNLWSDLGEGKPVVVHGAANDDEEAQYVIDTIDKLTAGGGVGNPNIDPNSMTAKLMAKYLGPGEDGQHFRYGDIAVFYRTNAQSRALETALVNSGINYRIVGGTKFYDRMEVKDALAYLRLVDNPDDTVSLLRVINTPRRGLGGKAIETLSSWASLRHVSVGQAVASVWHHSREDKDLAASGYSAEELSEDVEGLAPRARNAVAQFWQIIVGARQRVDEGAAPKDIIDHLLAESGYAEPLRTSDDPKDATRLENLGELMNAAADFSQQFPQGTLSDYLERVSLISDTDQLPGVGDTSQVTLMTVHTAKGLEFPVVFITGFEDGVFPHSRSLDNAAELAEERRLAYVAITRAQQQLYITRAAMRTQWGAPVDNPPSRFLDDLPEEVCDLSHAQPDMSTLFSSGGYGRSSLYSSSGVWGEERPKRSARRASFNDDDFGSYAYGGAGGASAQRKSSKVARRMVKPTAKSVDKPVESYAVGDRVNHQKFGLGTVIDVAGSGKQTTVRVDFGAGVTKRLLVRVAPMEKL